MKSNKKVFGGIFTIAIVILLLVLIPINGVKAYSDGPRNAGVGGNLSTIGTEAWTDPGNITTPGDPYAAVTLYHLHTVSNYLYGSNYGFVIPADAAITGIEVAVNRMASARNPSISDNNVILVKGGSAVGENRAIATPWPTSLAVAVYGGPTDLWGTTWTPAEINAADFGVALSAGRDNNGNNDRQAIVDTIQVTVYYSYTTSTGVECGDGTPVVYGDSVTCLATVTGITGDQTPSGTVLWTSDGVGTFDPNPCELSGVGQVATCTAIYTPGEVGTGLHLVTASYSGDEYYTPSSVEQTVDVLPRPVTVTADAQSKLYGEADPELTYQVTEGDLVPGDEFTGALAREPGEQVGTYAILQGSLALSANYDLTFIGNDFTIEKVDPTCEVIPYDVTYDGSEHTATGACLGVMGEELDGLDLTGTTHTDAGTYEDTWTFTDVTGNYNDLSGSVTDVIGMADPVCEVNGYNLDYDGSAHTAEGSCTGVMGELLDGLDLSGTTHTDAGLYSDTWTFVDPNGNYNNASDTVIDIILPVDPTCEVTGYTVEYDREVHLAEGTCLGVLGELLSGLDLSDTAHTDIGVYLDDPWSFTDMTGNYNDMNGWVDDEITLRMITVTADAKIKGIGQPDPELTYQVTSGSLLAGDEFSGALERMPGEEIGSYAILQGTLSLPEYYQITYIGADLTIISSVYYYYWPLVFKFVDEP